MTPRSTSTTLRCTRFRVASTPWRSSTRRSLSATTWRRRSARSSKWVFLYRSPQIHLLEDPGDILLFLTGEQEILDTCDRLEEEAQSFPEDKRNLIVATSLLSDVDLAAVLDAAPAAAAAGVRADARGLPQGGGGDEHRGDLDHHRRRGLRDRPRLQQAERVRPAQSHLLAAGDADQQGLGATARRSRRSYARGEMLPSLYGECLQRAAGLLISLSQR